MIEIIVNSINNIAKKKLVELEKILKIERLEYKVFKTTKEKNAKYFISRVKGNQVIVIGGDGTINEAVNGINKELSIIYIPSGSGNDLAKSLNLTSRINNIKDIIKSDYFEKYDVGVVNGRRFCSGFDLGFNSDVLKRANESKLKKYFKSNIYKISGVITLFRLKKYDAEYEIDDKKIKTNKLLMLNVMIQPYEGGGVKFAPNATGYEDKLHIMIMRDMNIFKFIYNYLCILINKHSLLKDVELYKTKCLKIKTNQSYYQMDGEIIKNNKEIKISCLNSFYKIKKN